MTTPKPTEIREFELTFDNRANNPVVKVINKEAFILYNEVVKVIEYRAVEQLNDQRLKLLTAVDDFNLDIEARDIEIATLKSKLAQFEGMTFSENQEILKLREQVAEHEQYKTDTFEAYSALDDVNIKLGEKIKDYEQALELIADRNAHGVMVTIAREVLKKWARP